MTEGPVLVTVVPARTANDVAVPSPTVGCAAYAEGSPTISAEISMRRPAPTATAAADHPRAGAVTAPPITMKVRPGGGTTRWRPTR